GKLAAFSAVWYVDSFFRWYRCPPTSALFPYTTLFRSRICINHQDVLRAKVRQLDADAIGMLGGIQLYAVEIDGTHRIGDGIDESRCASSRGEPNGRFGSEDALTASKIQAYLIAVNVEQVRALAGLGTSEVHSWHGVSNS